jgi:hypothetical protein
VKVATFAKRLLGKAGVLPELAELAGEPDAVSRPSLIAKRMPS